ncbi:MAG: hypothetical protein KTR14_08465 [Vampirovibrio sp.]|nr:hypothetical protein [Vampirovibrio sp.]
MDQPHPYNRSGRVLQADFVISRRQRVFNVLFILMGTLLILTLLGSLVVYGVKVQLESGINRLATETRDQVEENKEMQIRLNRAQSFNKVAEAVEKVPHLGPPMHIIEVRSDTQTSSLPRLPDKKPLLPPLTGY